MKKEDFMYYLRGSAEKEFNFDFRDFSGEKCGLALAFNIPAASHNVLDCLIAMEPRGEAGAGLVSYHESVPYIRKRIGPVSYQFREYDNARCSEKFPGTVAAGHCRYGTKGSSKSVFNLQPFLVLRSKYGSFALCHNGTLVNTGEEEERILSRGAAVTSTSDTEILVHSILHSGKKTLEEAIIWTLKKIKAAYSLIIIGENKAFAIRDKFGIRPLSIAKLGDGYLVCSETVAFEQFPEAKYLKDVRAGEMVVFEKKKEKMKSIQYARPTPRFCVFEPVYFMNPRSRLNDCYVEDIRLSLGRKMGEAIANKTIVIGGKKIKVNEADMVVPILDSGKFFAQGLAAGLGIQYLESFARMRNPRGDNQNRSFTAPTPDDRRMAILRKLNLRADGIAGKIVIVADDSIVRANTSKIIVNILKEAGARAVIFVAGFPPIVSPCINGMDFRTKKQLIACFKSIRQIQKIIGADKLFYLYESILFKVIRDTVGCKICGACFSGKYPVRLKIEFN